MPVTLSGVGHHFPERPDLFTGLTHTLEPGRVYGLTGPSGSGKSTLLGILAGWITPTAGTVVRTGISRVHWVFQNPHGVPRRTALDHVTIPLLGQGWRRPAAEARARALLAEVNLSAHAGSEFRHLSGGEGQRLMLARALAAEPDLLLVDEPTAQLDPRTAGDVIDVLSALAGRSGIAVIATHDPRVRDACSQTIELAA